MKVIPLHDRVLLKRSEEQETKKGGIIIPDKGKASGSRGHRSGKRSGDGRWKGYSTRG